MIEEIDIKWEKFLSIHTSGRDDSESDFVRFPYEATPYAVLERLGLSGYISKRNTLIDFGCGKGRVDFFLSYYTKCTSIGIEFNKRIYEKCIENKKTALSKNKVSFLNIDACEFIIPSAADRFYFFNPFCNEILCTVLNKIKNHIEKEKKDVILFFYYPTLKYIDLLLKVENLYLVDEIDCRDLFQDDSKETILVMEYRYGK